MVRREHLARFRLDFKVLPPKVNQESAQISHIQVSVGDTGSEAETRLGMIGCDCGIAGPVRPTVLTHRR